MVIYDGKFIIIVHTKNPKIATFAVRRNVLAGRVVEGGGKEALCSDCGNKQGVLFVLIVRE